MEIQKGVFSVVDAAAKDQGRYAINGVHLVHRDKKVLAETTDGRRALRLEWEAPEAEETKDVLVSSESWKAAGKVVKKSKAGELCMNGKTKVVCGDGISTIDLTPMEGIFPKIDRVVPQAEVQGVKVVVHAQLLGELLLAMAKACPQSKFGGVTHDAPYVTMTFHDTAPNAHPIKLVADSGTIKATGIIMPESDPEKKRR